MLRAGGVKDDVGLPQSRLYPGRHPDKTIMLFQKRAFFTRSQPIKARPVQQPVEQIYALNAHIGALFNDFRFAI